MKTIACVVLLSLVGCVQSASSPSQMSLIKNYQLCSSDTQCRIGEVCGFVAVDSYLVCKPGSHKPFS